MSFKHITEGIKCIEELFFPSVCFLCGNHISGNQKVVCRTCWFDLPEYGSVKPDKFLPKIYSNLNILFRFDSNAGQLIHLLKYERRLSLAPYFAQALFRRFPGLVSGEYHYLSPVPLYKVHQRERGYNQCELVCRELSSLTGISLNMESLVRIKNTRSQTNLNRQQRQDNVKNAFVSKNSVRDKKILLLDDVITTGSTLNACATALLKAGAGQVDVVVLAG